jgi:hypothetical protein
MLTLGFPFLLDPGQCAQPLSGTSVLSLRGLGAGDKTGEPGNIQQRNEGKAAETASTGRQNTPSDLCPSILTDARPFRRYYRQSRSKVSTRLLGGQQH